MKIPSNNQWTQTNNGDVFGVLKETQSFNFYKKAAAVLSQKAVTLYDSSDDADFGHVMAINYGQGKYFVVTDEKAFDGDLQGSSFTEIAASPTFAATSDSVIVMVAIMQPPTTTFLIGLVHGQIVYFLYKLARHTQWQSLILLRIIN